MKEKEKGRRTNLAPGPSESAAACKIWASLKGRLQCILGTARQYPSTVIIPLLVLLGLIAVGVTVVLISSDSAVTTSKDQALLDAKAAAELLTQVLHDMMQPTFSMGLYIQAHPHYPGVLQEFAGVTKALLDQVDHLNSMSNLQLAPRAQVTAVYPETKSSLKSIGLDLVEDHVTLVNLKQPPGRRLTLNGPILLYNEQVWAMIGAAIVFVPNVERNETFDIPSSLRECTPSLEYLCYDEATRSKFWGIVYSVIYLESFVTGPSTALGSLRNKNYAYLLIQESKNLDATPGITGPYGRPATVLARSDGDLSSDPIVVTIKVDQVSSFIPWTLMISKSSSSWEPSWKIPLLATVVVVSLVIAILIFILLLYMRQHQRLLYALMPRKLVQSMFQGDSFEAVLKDGALMLQAGTPMEKLMDILAQFMKGETPEMHDVVALRAAFMHGGETLFEPQNLRGQLQLNKDLADDVVNALVRELQGLGPGTDQTSLMKKHSVTASLTDDICLSGGTTVALSFIMRSQKRPDQTMDSVGLRAVGSVGRGLGLGGAASRISTSTSLLLPSSEDMQRDSPGGEVLLDVQALGGETCIVNAAGKAMNPCPAPGDQVHVLLEAGYGSWSFDAFALSEATDSHPLSVMFYFLLARSGLIKDLKLNPATVARLALALEDGYESNPYHNKTHAADVLQTMHAILVNTGMVVASDQKGYCPPLTLLACLLAAAGHDLGHKGVTNDFLICSEDQLATLYSDKSPMEHHHLAYLWTLLRNPSFNILSHLGQEESKKIRKTVIDLVSATDMKTHFSILSQFSIIHQLSGNTSPPQAASPHGRSSPVLPAPPNTDANFSARRCVAGASQAGSSHAAAHRCIPMDDAELILSLQIALKCADLGHIAETVQVHRQWVTCLEEEFFAQGDREKALGLPISPLFDRTKPGASKSQIGFYDFVVFPLFHNFSCAFPGAKPMVDLALTTYKFWKAAAPATDPTP